MKKVSKLFAEKKYAEILALIGEDKQSIQRQDIEAINTAGAAARALGRTVLAKKYWEIGVENQPNHAGLWNNLGVINKELGLKDEAIKCYSRALDIAPVNSDYLNNIAAIYLDKRDLKNAVSYLERAIKINPKNYHYWLNIANAQRDLHQYEQAHESYLRSIHLKNDDGFARICFALLLQRMGKWKEAFEQTEKAIKLDPENSEIRLNSIISFLPIMPLSENEGDSVLKLFDQRVNEVLNWSKKNDNLVALGQRVGYSQPFYLAYRPQDQTERLRKYGSLMCLASAAWWERKFKYQPNLAKTGNKKIRLGIMSAHISRHSVWDIVLKGIVKNIDKQKFELYFYYTGATHDEETEYATKIAKKFTQGPKDHHSWYQEIVGDQLDVFFVPEIGMDPFSMQMASLRLAPLQITSWGHPITSGLNSLDIFFSGELIEGKNSEKHYVEKLVKLSGTGVCTERLPVKIKKVKIESLQNQPDVVKFFICQHAFKYSELGDRLVTRIISQVKNARLVIVRDDKYKDAFQVAKERLIKEFENQGVDTNHIVEVPWTNRPEFLGLMNEVDIYLDLPNFSGYTTAWQALHQGLPIVTIDGQFMRQKLAAGLLKQINEYDLIANSEDEYVKKAIELAKDHQLRQEIKSRILKNIPKLDNQVEVVREFESVLIRELKDRGYEFDWPQKNKRMEIEYIGKWDKQTLKNLFENPKIILNLDWNDGELLLSYAKEYGLTYLDSAQGGSIFSAIGGARVDALLINGNHLFNSKLGAQKVLEGLKDKLIEDGTLFVKFDNARSITLIKQAVEGALNISGLDNVCRLQEVIKVLTTLDCSIEKIIAMPELDFYQQMRGQDLTKIKNLDMGFCQLKDLMKDDLIELMAKFYVIKLKFS